KLVGKTFRDALVAYDDSALMGLLDATEQLLLPPPLDYVIRDGDQVIAISEDDDTVIVNGRAFRVDEKDVIANPPPFEKKPERTLILGTSERLGLVLGDLAPYCAEGSATVIVGEDQKLGDKAVAESKTAFPHLGASFRLGDITERKLLDTLDVT